MRVLVVIFTLISVSACAAPRAYVEEVAPPHETFTIESEETKETRRVNVYLPPGYGEQEGLDYPVLYMPDGGVKEDFPHLANTVDAAIRAGEMRPLLVVGIENTERRRDMTGPTEVEQDRKVAPRVGGSAAFRGFIANELVPEIESRYRVSSESGIIGESAAGLFIVETFFLQPALFDTYIAISPSLWWNDEELVRKASGRLSADPGLEGTLYLSCADEADVVPAATRLAEILRRDAPAGLRWHFEPQPNLRHNNIYRAVSPQVLRMLFPVLAPM